MNGPVRVDDTIIWGDGYHRQMTRREKLLWMKGSRFFPRTGPDGEGGNGLTKWWPVHGRPLWR